MKTIVLTGGGTAGHVTPHLALIPELKKKGYEIHYIGTEDGIEHGMMNRIEGITYHAVKSGGRRRTSPARSGRGNRRRTSSRR